jgi:hypothetical protein
MKYTIAIFLILLTAILSCNTSKEKGKLFTESILPTSKYTINVERDTTLQTDNDALLKIPAGALKPENGKTVTLEIKEAYSLSQMIKAGLFTQSDGQPLSSGGMIYISAAEGQNVTFSRPIKVAVPADYLQDGMQLYSGESNNGKINWTNAKALPENKQLESIENGKILFQKNCTSCHSIEKDLTGPALAHFPKRFGWKTFGGEGLSPDWYHGFFTWPQLDPIKPIKELVKADTPKIIKDSTPRSFQLFNNSEYEDLKIYVCNRINQFGSRGTPIDLKTDERQDIFNYIQNESDRRSLADAYSSLKDCTDSCSLYKEKVRNLKEQKNLSDLKRQELIKENGPLVKTNPDSTWNRNIDTDDEIVAQPINFEEKVSPNYYDAVYYQFSIESFGWHNIDMMLNDVKGVEESELFVRVVGDYKDKVETFFIIPSVKTYAEGGPADRNPQEFAFFYKNGKIPLPQNTDAYILSVTETENSIAYGLKKFTTRKYQEIEISLHASTKEEFIEEMKKFDMERLHIKVDDSKNSNEIRKTDTTLKEIDMQLIEAEKLKPKKCDCDCELFQYAATADATKVLSPIINQSKKDLSIIAYPNPSTNVFTLRLESSNQVEEIIMNVVDINGRMMETRKSLIPNQSIKFGENYKPGIYITEVVQGKERKTIKLIKQ